MEASKVILSEAERRLITDANIILTKNSAIDKVVELFGLLSVEYRNTNQPIQNLYPEHFYIHPKISKGEKHHDLPWVMLDYPRTFNKHTGHLAIRTLFWWGKFFSIRLHVSARYLQPAINAITQIELSEDWLSGLTADPWDFELPNKKWLPLTHPLMAEPDGELYLILAKKIPITGWESVLNDFSEDYRKLTELISLILCPKPMK